MNMKKAGLRGQLETRPISLNLVVVNLAGFYTCRSTASFLLTTTTNGSQTAEAQQNQRGRLGNDYQLQPTL